MILTFPYILWELESTRNEQPDNALREQSGYRHQTCIGQICRRNLRISLTRTLGRMGESNGKSRSLV